MVAGAKAQHRGRGRIKHAGDYHFLSSATDGQVTGGGGSDKFRPKITDRASGALVYDNVSGATDDLEAASPQVISGGSIVIHKAK